MNNVSYSNEYALELLKIINKNLSEMNRFTDEIIMCIYDELEENIAGRDKCFEKVKECYEKLKKFKTDENAEFSAIISGKADYNLISKSMREIFNEFEKMKSFSKEITSKDEYVNQKLCECRDKMIAEIKKLNSGVESQASKYYSNSSGDYSGNIYFPRRNKQI